MEVSEGWPTGLVLKSVGFTHTRMFRYTSRPGASCEAGIDSITDITGRCECGPQRDEDSSFGCIGVASPSRTPTRRQVSAPGYQEFPLITGVDNVF
jgi:hypothetical protein